MTEQFTLKKVAVSGHIQACYHVKPYVGRENPIYHSLIGYEGTS